MITQTELLRVKTGVYRKRLIKRRVIRKLFHPPIIIDKKTKSLLVIVPNRKIARYLKSAILKIIKDEKIIRTGKYKRSIRVSKGKKAKVISFRCPYSIFLEFGTAKMKAKHIFGRAIKAVNLKLIRLGKSK